MTKTIKYPELASKLKELRGDIPVKDFAEKLGVDLGTYYRYERGQSEAKEPLMRLAEIVSLEIAAKNINVSEPKKEYDPHGGWKPRSIEQLVGVPEGHGMGRAVEMLARIYSSKNENVIRAIFSNLRVFCERVDQDDEIASLKRDMAELRELIKNHAKAHAYYGEERRSGFDRRQNEGIGPDGIERRSGVERRKPELQNGNN